MHGVEPIDAGALARIRAHLAGKPNAALVAMIVELAERDPALFRKLEIASANDGADEKVLAARLGKSIDQATATRGFIEYGGRAAGPAASTKRSTLSKRWTPGTTALSSSWPSARSTGSKAQSNPSTIRRRMRRLARARAGHPYPRRPRRPAGPDRARPRPL